MLRDEDTNPPEFTGVPIEPYRGPLVSTLLAGSYTTLPVPSAGGLFSVSTTTNLNARYWLAIDEATRANEVESWAKLGLTCIAALWALFYLIALIGLVIPFAICLFAFLMVVAYPTIFAVGFFNTARSVLNFRRAMHRRRVAGFIAFALLLDSPILWLLCLFLRWTVFRVFFLSASVALDSFPPLC